MAAHGHFTTLKTQLTRIGIGTNILISVFEPSTTRQVVTFEWTTSNIYTLLKGSGKT